MRRDLNFIIPERFNFSGPCRAGTGKGNIESSSPRRGQYDAIMRVAETAPNAGHVRQEPVADARNTKGAGREREEKKDR